ncbi:MAG: Decarbamoylnovobiocin carbamoyltransferase [Alphaproteobacteria bacterium MarineAlpha5_Bin12]|nr:MAG: Decarbamoylnovobiocin carbamoyltransferase [Alphaproteobacteria bacterium MarineAlpha5_Bin12]|tara:strand:- start:41863 stop:43701 length:1839 start_codon:yes stop_codon:yes gene_type:complete
MIILGVSAYYHDSAACLIKDGEIVNAVQEERFSRIKHDSKFPIKSILFCLKNSNYSIDNVDYIVFYDKPFIKFERLLETYLAFAPKGFVQFYKSFQIWIKEKLFQKRMLIEELEKISKNKSTIKSKLLFSEHHLSHAASAFFPSPFEESAILTMDAVGEWATTSFGIGKGNYIEIDKEINFPHSLGLLYSAMTYYTGFKVNSGEYKVMGLAPYGQARFSKIIKDNLIQINDDGSFRLNMEYFNYCHGLTMTSKKFENLFGSPPRKAETLITQREMDLAASIQEITEEIVIKISRYIAKQTKQKNICLAGGVALNCVANGKLLKENIFKNIWIQPAAGDAGGALGAALNIHYLMLKNKRKVPNKLDLMKGSYLGPDFNHDQITNSLKKLDANFMILKEEEILEKVSKDLSKGKAIGWHQGKMEFGPRALGARSILGDPRSPTIQKILNLKIKYRESFRPFAPSILEEDLQEWFDLNHNSPYMLMVAEIVKNKQLKMNEKQKKLFGIDKLNIARSNIPAVTHVDYSARIQTVHKDTNPKYYKLIKKFKDLTGCPILVNTSFNIRGEPIVLTPEDAYKCFMGTELDILVIGNCYMEKINQNKKTNSNYQQLYELD